MGGAHKKGGNKKKNLLDQMIENQSEVEKRRKAAERNKPRDSKRIQSHGAKSPNSQRRR